jgi:hypothetical protein
MKNGTTRMAYKAEHAVDPVSDLVVSADRQDVSRMVPSAEST